MEKEVNKRHPNRFQLNRIIKAQLRRAVMSTEERHRRRQTLRFRNGQRRGV